VGAGDGLSTRGPAENCRAEEWRGQGIRRKDGIQKSCLGIDLVNLIGVNKGCCGIGDPGGD